MRFSISVSGISFNSPVLPAAGPNVRTAELMRLAVEAGAGGIVTKTISVVPADDPRPTIRSIAGKGLVNCETWAESDYHEFIDDCKKLKSLNVPLVVSIGYKPDEVRFLGRYVDEELAPDAIEFSTHYVGQDVEPLIEIAQALRESVSCPVWMKISPNLLNIDELAVRVSEFVDAFVAINSYGPVLDFDAENPVPRLGSQNGYGWMSGAPILPIALRIVHQIASVQDKPVIGVGGIENGIDAVKMIMAGASLVQICSAAIKFGHKIYGKVAKEIEDWLSQHGHKSLDEIRGIYDKNFRARISFSGRTIMTVSNENCTGCGICVKRCVQGAIVMKAEKASVLPQKCIGCGFCQDFCKFDAMKLSIR